MTTSTVRRLLNDYPSKRNKIDDKFFGFVRFGCFTYEAYKSLFPNGKHISEVKKYLSLKAEENAPKTTIERAMSYTGKVAVTTIDMYKKSWENRDKWSKRKANSSDYSVINKTNIDRFELWKTQYEKLDY